jgi:tRNA pseudouridine38-40 synthase
VTAQRIAAGLEYDGRAFHGWQTQSHARSIQAELNQAIGVVADHPVRTAAAGRTDAGVHATGQVVHFDTDANRSIRSWLLGINSNLPADISVHWVREVPGDFHARYSAVARTYRYLVRNHPVRSALNHARAFSVREPLHAEAMSEAAKSLLGEHDFSAFRGAGCQARSPVRRVLALDVQRVGDCLQIEVRANGFLYHMVRNIVGALVHVGSGKASPGWIHELLESRDRRHGAPTAPADGLYLAGVHYPAHHGFPLPAAPPGWQGADRPLGMMPP